MISRPSPATISCPVGPRGIWPLLGLVGTLLAGCEGATGDRTPRGPDLRPGGPNVILISVDTLRADHLSLYGYPRPTSPGLEDLAREAVVFDRFYQNGGATLPSHMTMMTSLYPRAHWVTPQTGRTLDPSRVTLAESFQAAGYATAAFVDGGWLAARFGFGQGFALYESADGGGLESILPRVERWLQKHRDRRFFLFVHTYDVHSKTDELPYECPGAGSRRYVTGELDFDGCRDGRCASELLADLDGRLERGEIAAEDAFTPRELETLTALYDGCISYVDDKLRTFLGSLRRRGLFDDALVVITSDHGEELLDHGRLLHHQTGFEELARVPLIVKLPGARQGGRRVPHLGAMVDLMPTLLEVAGLPVPPEAQGRSLLPAIEADRPVRDDLHIYSVLRTGRYKYFAESNALYDLEEDPEERNDLSGTEVGLVERLKKRVWQLVSSDIALFEGFENGASSAPPSDLSDQERDKLKALGYLAN